jgi:hypothetical protein
MPGQREAGRRTEIDAGSWSRVEPASSYLVTPRPLHQTAQPREAGGVSLSTTTRQATALVRRCQRWCFVAGAAVTATVG